MGKTIEIFTKNRNASKALESKVREYACSRCSIVVYDASDPTWEPTIKSKAAEYGVVTLPAVTIDGKLVPIEKLNRSKVSKLVRQLMPK